MYELTSSFLSPDQKALLEGVKRELEEEFRKFGLILDEEEVILFFDEVFRRGGIITVVIGARRSGKTAWSIRAGEIAREYFGRTVQILQPYEYPGFETIAGLEHAKNGALVILDEAHIRYHARRAMRRENVFANELISISGHKDLSMIFITQLSSQLDRLIVANADYFILKDPPPVGIGSEREDLKTLVTKAHVLFRRLPKSQRRAVFLVHSREFYDFLWQKYGYLASYFPASFLIKYFYAGSIIKGRFRLPRYWGESLSKQYSDFGSGEWSGPLGMLDELPETFSTADVAQKFRVSERTARRYIRRWVDGGLVERVGRGTYRRTIGHG